MPAPVPERRAALAAGEVTYRSSTNCRNGHKSPLRYTKTGKCLECMTGSRKRWRTKNPEKVVANARRYQAAHPEKVAAYKKTAAYRETQLKGSRKYYQENREACVERTKRWQAKNPDKVRLYQRKTAINNQEAQQRRRLRYIESDPARHKLQRVAIQNKHRARKRGNGGTATSAEISALKAKQKGRCAGCGKRRLLELDHITPLSKGGRHDSDNLQFLCRSCNASKSARDVIVWAQENGRLL